MNMNKTGTSVVHWGSVFSVIATIGLLTSCGGGSIGVGNSSSPSSSPKGCGTSSHTTPAQPAISTISATDAAIVATLYHNSGASVQYFCDCTGPGATCSTSGNDLTGSGTQVAPYQTINAAMTWLNGGTNRTAALCQGGSFTPPSGQGQFGFALATNASCPSGSTCNELREYPFGGTGAKPIINNLAGTNYLFSTINGGGGYRFLNLKLQGTPNPPSGGNVGFFLYSNTSIGNPLVHDIEIENVDLDSFDLGINDALTTNSGITIQGNHFTNITNWGYLGGSSNLTISYNSFINSGSDTVLDHAIYFASHTPVSNVSIVGNFITGVSGTGSCAGSPFTGHAAVTNLTVSGNVVVENTNALSTCYGIGFTNTTSAQGAIFLRNALFSDNIVVNGGSIGIAITSCPSCVVENNLIISQTNAGGAGIATPSDTARPQDDVECYANVVNNTVYYETTSTQGMKGGVSVGGEGTGYTVANNTVMYGGASSGLNQANCFSYSLPLASYSFINNNNCYSNDHLSTYWVSGQSEYPFAAWQTYSATAGLTGTGFDTASSTANPGWSFATPLTIPALDETKTGSQLFALYFTPVGAPLVGAGNAANAPATDITTTARPAPPSIGAYE